MAGNNMESVLIRQRHGKERFLMFTRGVLMKYLEQKDPAMHQQAKTIIKDCAERNKQHERGYESFAEVMRERLKGLVGELYWKRAERYLNQFLLEKNNNAAANMARAPGAAPAA